MDYSNQLQHKYEQKRLPCGLVSVWKIPQVFQEAMKLSEEYPPSRIPGEVLASEPRQEPERGSPQQS